MLRPGMTHDELLEAVFLEVPEARQVLQELAAPEATHFQDAQGQIYEHLPECLASLQWLVLRLTANPFGFQARPADPIAPPLTSTSTTTTQALARNRAGQTVSFILVAPARTIRLPPVRLQEADPTGAVIELVQAAASMGLLGQPFQLQLPPALPWTTSHQHYVIPLLLTHPGQAPTVLYDPGLDGTQIHSITVGEGALGEELLAGPLRRQGASIYVNGIHVNGMRRVLQTGDLVQQLGPQRYIGTVRNVGPLLAHISRLRCLSFPLALPPFGLFEGPNGPCVAPLQGVASMQELVINAFERRLDRLGRPGAGKKSVWVLQPARAPHILWLDIATTPTVQQATPLLQASGLFPDDTTVVEADYEANTLVMDSFLALPTAAPYVTCTLADPFAPTHLLLLHPTPGAEPPFSSLPLTPLMRFLPVAAASTGMHLLTIRGPVISPSLAGESTAPAAVPAVHDEPPAEEAEEEAQSLSLLQHQVVTRRGVLPPTGAAALTALASSPPRSTTDVVPGCNSLDHQGPGVSQPGATAHNQSPAHRGLAVVTPFGRRLLGAAGGTKRTPGVISLDDALSAHPPREDKHSGPTSKGASPSMHCLDSLRALLPVLDDWAACWTTAPPFRVCGAAKAALSGRHAAGAWPISELQLFTDGSFMKPGHFGWAVTVFEKCYDGYGEWLNFQGYFSGSLQPWVVTGLADCQRLGNTAQLLCRTRHLFQALQRRPRPVCAAWVPSHVGLPPNELTDIIAKFACQETAKPLPAKVLRLLLDPTLGWLWHFLWPAPSLPPLAALVEGSYEPPDRLSDILRELFAAKQQHIIFFQESSPLGAIDKRHVKVLHAEPRLLIARLNAPRLSCYLVSAHAPHSGCTSEEIRTWWEATGLKVGARCTGHIPVFYGCDANAQLGQVTGPGIGAHAADVETFGGEMLRYHCATHALCAPSAFAGTRGLMEHADPSAYTWVSPSGGKYRLDYLLLPQSLLPAVRSCQVFHDFDDGGPDDHFPVSVTLVIAGLPEGAPTFEYPRIRLRTVQEVREAQVPVHGACQALASHPWSGNVHEHVACLDRAIWTCCKEASAAPKPRRPYVHEDSWALIRQRKSLLGQIHDESHRAARARLLLGFRTLCVQTGHRSRNRRTLLRIASTLSASVEAKAQLISQRKALRKELVRSLAQAKAAYVEEVAQRFVHASRKADVRALFEALRFFRPAGKGVFKGFGPLAVLHDSEGAPAATHSQQQELHRRHFEGQEAGHVVGKDSLCAPVAEIPSDARFRLQDLPTLHQVEVCIRQSRDGKAPGPSGIPICVWKACPDVSAAALLPIFLKSHVRLTEPIQYRGAKLSALFKKAGLAIRAESFRSIALMDPSAKIHHKLMRPGLLENIEMLRAPLQQGCLPNSLPTALTHFLVTKMRTASLKGLSSAVVFLDLTAAYYRLIREAIVDTAVSDDKLCSVLQRLQIAPEQVHEVEAFVRQGGLLPTASPHFKRALAMMYRHTFFVMDGLQDITATTVGSRPGDAISDTMFALAATSLLAEVGDQLSGCGLPGYSVPTWADDLALPITAPAPRLGEAMELTGRVLHQACLKRAMQPNYGQGKTEALVSFTGPGARLAAKDLFRTGAGCVELQVVPKVPLRCVFQYKHLGTTLAAKARPAKDIRCKLGAAGGAAHPLAKKVLRRKDVQQGTRSQLLDTLAFSRAAYGVAIWGDLDASTRLLWQGGIAALYRAATRPTITEHGPTFPALVVDALREEAELTEHSWWSAADKAVLWFDELCSGTPRYQAYATAEAFLNESVCSPHKVGGQIRRAKRRAVGLCDSTSDAIVAEDLRLKPFQCEDCEERFATLQQVRAHSWSKHGHQTVLAQLTPEHTCPACLHRFWHRSRLLRHVHHDKLSCGHFVLAAQLAQCAPDAPAPATSPLPATLSLPAARVPGPLPRPVPDQVSGEQLAKFYTLGLLDTEQCDVEFSIAGRCALSEWQLASASTRDAVLAALTEVQAGVFEALLREAGLG
ncbi:unnamed protein product [Symbiodinium sp. CCMP2592]|nr:unnamed protein product [Symbiodinium sp. CCMP2592]